MYSEANNLFWIYYFHNLLNCGRTLMFLKQSLSYAEFFLLHLSVGTSIDLLWSTNQSVHNCRYPERVFSGHRLHFVIYHSCVILSPVLSNPSYMFLILQCVSMVLGGYTCHNNLFCWAARSKLKRNADIFLRYGNNLLFLSFRWFLLPSKPTFSSILTVYSFKLLLTFHSMFRQLYWFCLLYFV